MLRCAGGAVGCCVRCCRVLRAVQKVGEGSFPRVLHPSPRSNTRNGQKVAEEPRRSAEFPSAETRGRIVSPGFAPFPAKQHAQRSESSGRATAQRQNPRKSDSQGPRPAPLGAAGTTRARRPTLTDSADFPSAETRGRIVSAGFVPSPAKQHAQRSETRGRNPPPTFCLSARSAHTSRSGRATRTRPRPSIRPPGSRAAVRVNPPGALGLWR